MPRKSYNIAGRKFDSKKSCQDFAKSILYSDTIGSVLSGGDLDYMLAFFQQFHSEWILKKAGGIKYIRRVKEPLYGKHRAFWIERLDGTETDISYIIHKIERRNYYNEFCQAMREVIKPQIDHFRIHFFKRNALGLVKCPISGKVLSIDDCHVDHYNPTFKELIDQFLLEFNVKITPDLFPNEEDCQMYYDIKDEDLKFEFYVYHEHRANLRILSKEANLRRL